MHTLGIVPLLFAVAFRRGWFGMRGASSAGGNPLCFPAAPAAWKLSIPRLLYGQAHLKATYVHDI